MSNTLDVTVKADKKTCCLIDKSMPTNNNVLVKEYNQVNKYETCGDKE